MNRMTWDSPGSHYKHMLSDNVLVTTHAKQKRRSGTMGTLNITKFRNDRDKPLVDDA